MPRPVHRRPVSDDIRLAWIAGVASRYAPWKVPEGEALTHAIAEVQEVATDHTGALRTDLLGQQAGLHRGLALGRPDHVRAQADEAQAALLVEAGADPEVMAEWVPIGVERAKGPSVLRPHGRLRP